MGLTILSTKLQVPPPPAKTLERPRLFAQLTEAFQVPVTLIAAEAGFGKSTLVASFLAADTRPAIWYRLDPADSDPAVFAAYLLHGLKPYIPRQTHTAALRGLGLVTDWNAAAQLLSPALHRLRNDTLVVLDDFHLLVASTLGDGMSRLIETLPPRAHLAILTRVLPQLPFSRWRGQGRLAEVDAGDLPFTVGELRTLLVDLHGLPLSDASLHIIAARTEGWPAGVVLALHTALARGPADVAQSLAALSGSTRTIYDYLAQEAFARQTAAAQKFMLATAAVSRFSLALADTLLGSPSGENQEILDHLERSHLFIVPLDQERRWYRYHHLFQEFLQRIGMDRDAAWVQDVHRRAAEWWERAGESGEVLLHLVAAGDVQRAALLLGARGVDLVAQGQFETIHRWLAAIPEETWATAPRLYLIRGLTELVLGDTGAAGRALDEARRRLRATGDVEGEIMALRWLVNAAAWGGGLSLLKPLRSDIAEMETRLPEFPPAARAHVLAAGGRIAHWTGDRSGAERRFRDALETARSSGDDYAYIWCARPWVERLISTARFREAASTYEDLLFRARRKNWSHEAAHLHTELAHVLLSVGRDDDAERHLGEAQLLQTTIPCRVLHADLAQTSAQAAVRRGARDRAETLLRELIGPGERATPYGLWRFRAALDLSLLIANTDRDEAEQLLARAATAQAEFGILHEGEALLAAGIVTRSFERCRQAADVFASAGAPHLQALALLNAVAIAPGTERMGFQERALSVLRTLAPEAWEFLLAHASPALLAAFAGDQVVGPHVIRLTAAVGLPETRMIIRCLGAFELIRQGIPVGQDAWPRAAPRRLFQYLLLQERPVHREEVIEALWPSADPGQGANQLRVALAQLRRVLEPERRPREASSLLLASRSTIVLARDRIALDLDRFRRALSRASASPESARREALAEVIALYRGPLFADEPFEEWTRPHRDRLGRQYVEALTLLAETEEHAGHHEAALSRWLATVETDPGAEQAYRGLIRCYLVLGRVAEAVRAFESCRQALAELGVAPSPETLALRDSIPGQSQETRR